MSREIQHTAFLVRWQGNDDQVRWRSTIENAYTGEIIYFTDKNELMRFLWQLLFENPSDLSSPNEADKGKK